MVVHDAPRILVLAAENETEGLSPIPTLLTEEYLAWAVRKKDQELLQAADNFIARIKEDGSITKMIGRWIPFGT